MNDLTYSGDGGINSENNIKDLLLKIFILFSIISFIIFLLLNFSGIRMFNSLNLSMSLVSTGGFLPTESLDKIIRTNTQKLILIFSFLISMLNFFLILNIFERKIIMRQHKEDFYLIHLKYLNLLLNFV